ncbi:MAG: mitofilin family membrane protein [Marinomonas sp.]
MSSRFGSRKKSGQTKPILLTALASFAIGAGGVGYYMWQMDRAEGAPEIAAPAPTETVPAKGLETLNAGKVPQPTSTQEAVTEAAEEATEAVERVEEQQGGLDSRLAAAEQRLTRLDLQAQAAASNVARAEGLLIAFATRRALQRDQELGYLADQLRLRFGDNWPNAVSTVIAFSRDPVRLDRLLARLEGLGPKITQADEGLSFANLSREISDLFTVRSESTPSPQPEKRLERARYFLETGRYASAVAEVENLPGAAEAADWISDAKRYAAAMEALETIETAAVIDADRMNDGAGNPLVQPVKQRRIRPSRARVNRRKRRALRP